MAVAFGSAGTSAVGTTSVSPACPATVNGGDLLIAIVANKYPTNGPSTPSGWTLLCQYSGGAGSAGLDSGTVYVTVYVKIGVPADAGATVAITVTGGNSAVADIVRYTKTAGKTWSIAVTGGSDNSAGTAWSVTGDVDPGFTSGDMALAAAAINSDGFAVGTSPAIAASGATFGAMTQRFGVNTTQGDDCRVHLQDCAVTAGTSAGVPTYTATAAGTSGNAPAGATAIIRLREVDSVGSATGTSTAAATGSTDSAGAGATTGTSTAAATGSGDSTGSGAATGAGTAAATGSAASAGTGAADGTSDAAATGQADSTGDGAAAGASTASSTGASGSAGSGSAAGDSAADASSSAASAGVGVSAGDSDASATGEMFTFGDGAAAGTSTAWGFPPIRFLVADDPVAERIETDDMTTDRPLALDAVVDGRIATEEAIEVDR